MKILYFLTIISLIKLASSKETNREFHTDNSNTSKLYETFIKNLEHIDDGHTVNYYTDHTDSDSLGERNETYDFVVIGASPSGSVIANRLSEIGEWNVLLIEAGEEASPITDIPSLVPALQFTKYDWGYQAERQDGFCKGCINGSLKWPHGKALGGSTIINFMIMVRGNRLDYDRWAAMGNPGWSYEEVLPYFLKSEDALIERQDVGYHHRGGYLTVTDVPYRTKSAQAFVKAAEEAGMPYTDYNGKNQMGVSFVQGTLRNGRRCSAEKAFLRPARNRKNLKILTKARVVKILIKPDTKEAYGVKYYRNNKYRIVLVSKEVILCAGGLNSPQLLMLSGIGPKEHLKELGIPVIHDLPVGQKMYDHATFSGVSVQVNDTNIAVNIQKVLDPKAFLEFYLKGQGPFTILGGAEALSYIQTNASTDPEPSYPDVELLFGSGGFNNDYGLISRKMFNIPRKTYDIIWKPFENKGLFQVFPILMHPRSYGYIRLRSNDPFEKPKYYANYFTDSENHDIKTFIAAVREIERIIQSPALQKYKASLVRTPVPGCEQHDFDTDDYWECAVRTITATYYHQVATCKMGPSDDPEAVVDAKLQVYGIKKLRVSDVSIIPLPPTAHTAGPAYMVGEKTSDLIKERWMKNEASGSAT